MPFLLNKVKYDFIFFIAHPSFEDVVVGRAILELFVFVYKILISNYIFVLAC